MVLRKKLDAERKRERKTYLRASLVHMLFTRFSIDALSVPPLGQVFGGGVLGLSWPPLGLSWALLGRCWALLGRSWAGLGVLEAFWVAIELSGASFGFFLVDF